MTLTVRSVLIINLLVNIITTIHASVLNYLLPLNGTTLKMTKATVLCRTLRSVFMCFNYNKLSQDRNQWLHCRSE